MSVVGKSIAAYLSAGSCFSLEMNGPVKTWGCPDIDEPASCVLGLILSQHTVSPPGQYSLPLRVGVSLSLQVEKVSLSLSIP